MQQEHRLELGLDTFGDITVDDDGRRLSEAEVIRNVIDEGVLADQVGADFFGVGEHHRDDFAISAPEVALAAIAGRTQHIRLGSAVTVLSSDDPVRVFQRFSTLDAASGGRAEVILGRGSFIESFPLFGYDLDDYDALFTEKLDLLLRLREDGPVTWSGEHRAPLHWHDTEEILLFLEVEGDCYVYYEDREYPVASNCSVVIPPNVVHSFGIHGAGSMRTLSILPDADARPGPARQ